MNGSNFNFNSSLLCSRGNVSCSKEPKYTSKSRSTHPYRCTYALSKQFQEIECQNAFSMRYQNTQHFYDTQILKPGFQGHEQRRRLVEMKNNSNFSHIRICVRDDYLDHAVTRFVHRSQRAVDAVKNINKNISLGGEVRAAPITLTLFKTNIADFPTLFKTEFRFFNTLFKTFTRILINKRL